MRQERPPSVLVIAIFHFIIGGFGLMCNLCGMAGQVVGNAAMLRPNASQVQVQREIEKADPTAKVVEIANGAISLCLACVLLVAGFGLLNMAPWGRSLSLAYGYTALIEKVAMAIYTILVTLPTMNSALQPLLAQAGSPQERRGMEVGFTVVKVFLFVFLLVPLIYPFVVLIVMNTARVRNAFQGADDASFDDGGGRSLQQGFGDEPFRPGPDDRYKA